MVLTESCIHHGGVRRGRGIVTGGWQRYAKGSHLRTTPGRPVIRLLLPLLAVAALVWGARRYRSAAPAQKQRLRSGLYVVVAVLVAALVLRATGLHPLAVLGTALAALARLAWRLLPLLTRVAGSRSAAEPPTSQGPAAPPRTGMDRAQALEVLGLQENATREQIVAKHRQLVRDLHPDKGGSTFLTQQINQARDVLLG